ncbi:hypothetical protein ACFQ9V_08785 [Leifsonia sp. NPDC056665]|uniref:hypothetical protein n=1 Tax=Leifsonia sp. NPDC056665 TaxID=3345901 RepID=UPI003683C1BC
MVDRFRTHDEALRLRPVAIQFLMRIEAILPPGEFEIHYGTTFVGETVPEEVGCAGVTVRGIARSLTALEFNLDDDPQEYAEALIRYRERLIEERHDAERPPE